MNFFLMLVIALCISLTSFALWLMEAPRSVPWIKIYVEEELNDYFAQDAHIRIKDIVLKWNKEEKRLGLHATEVQIDAPTLKHRFELPEVRLGFSLFKLLHGHLIPSNVTIFSPQFRLHYGTGDTALTPEALIQQSLAPLIYRLFYAPQSFPLRRITLKNTSLYLSHPRKETAWHFPLASLTIDKEKIEGRIKAELTGKETELLLHITKLPSELLQSSLTFQSLPFTTLKDLFPTLPAPITEDRSSLALSGTVTLDSQKDGTLGEIHFTVPSLSGTLDNPAYFPNALPITKASLKGSFNSRSALLKLENLELHLENGASLQTKGEWHFGEAQEIKLTASVEKLPVSHIGHLWPIPLAPTPRQWVTSNIAGGIVSKASATLTLKAEDFIKDSWPKEALDASVSFEDVSLTYAPFLPSIHHIQGTALFNGMHIDITAGGGKTVNSVIDKARVIVPYSSGPEHKVIVEGTGKGPAADLLAFVPKEVIELAKKKGTLLGEVSGNAETSVYLAIPLITSMDWQDITYNIKSSLSELSLPQVKPAVAITGGQFTSAFDGKSLQFNGKALLNGTPADMSWAYHFMPASEEVIKATLATSLSKANSQLLGIPSEWLEEGSIASHLTIEHKGDHLAFAGKFDLENASFALPDWGLFKEKGEKSQLELKGSLDKNDHILFHHIALSGDKLSLKGKAKLSKDRVLESADFEHVAFGAHDLSVHYAQQEKEHTLKLTGKSLDLASFNWKNLQADNNPLMQKAWHVTLRIQALQMKNEEVFTNAEGEFHCLAHYCDYGKFQSMLGDHQTVKLELDTHNGTRTLDIYSNAAGTLIRALDISTNVKGGELSLHANGPLSDKAPLSGMLVLSQFTTARTPILARLITLSSLPGILQLLEKKGIYFDKMKAPFRKEKEIVTLKNAKAAGPSLGITIDGSINTKEHSLNLSGILIPSVYGINSLIGKVPLICNLLMGGKNEGIIAANYSIKGNYETATTVVNPLSILTPGFLRKLFDVRKLGKKAEKVIEEEKNDDAPLSP